MTDSPHRGRDEQWGFGDGPDRGQQGYGYPGYTDPAYASQAPYGPTYQAPGPPAPTERLPSYSPYGYDPHATGQYGAPYEPADGVPPPEDPKSPRWLWLVAGVAVVTVIGLVIALVIVNSSRQQTVVAPVPPTQEPDFTTSRPTPPSRTSRTPSIPVLPLPTAPTVPDLPTLPEQSTPGLTQTVVYQVSGDGRAINITYVDSGGLLQTEFNVMLPWSTEVELTEPAEASASVSIINVGPEVNCTITVDGVVVQQRTGAGLTICTGSG